MKTFIQELAEIIVREYPDWNNLTVVFPNRRAALYFRKALGEALDTPRWAPDVQHVEAFIGSFSELVEADKLSLVVKLYRTFKQVTGSDEDLDYFYFWGEMLLRDFDELDKYLVPAASLFRDMSNQKEIDEYFDYLTEEQKKFLTDFWQSVEFGTADSKQRFLELWRGLYTIYTEFRQQLAGEGMAYGGMIHRAVAEGIGQTITPPAGRQYIFAGFNALTSAEEAILSWFVLHRKARVFWDEDAFYVQPRHREAGAFFRQYRGHAVLGATFPEQPGAYLGTAKEITVLGVPQKAGQPKLLAQRLEAALKQPGMEAGRIVVVLPDESLLLPVLYALPPSLQTINVTMGFPLVSTPYYTLIDLLFDLHLHQRKGEFYFRYVLALLNHPYLKGRVGDAGNEWREFILKHNQVHLAPSFFEGHALARVIFQPVDLGDFLSYLLNVIEVLATSGGQEGLMEKEFAFHFHRILTRVKELAASEPMNLRMQQRMFRQIARAEKVPFTGEPLRGLQIMGVLETRNLDFDRVIVLSLNEGLWPAAARQGSYIPHNIRKAYRLPTAEHQDAMYAYLFYRLLQRASIVDLYYNTEPDVLGTREMSRYLYQLIYETGWPFSRQVLYNPVQIHPVQPISIEKKADVLEKLERYFGKALTPSTLNTYIECRLQFYFKHLQELREPDEVEEEADARIFGNILHRVMELFYTALRPPSGPWRIQAGDFTNLNDKLEYFIERAFREHFHLPDEKPFEYEGRQLVVKEMVKRFASKVLRHDARSVPFVIELLEANNFTTTIAVRQRDKSLSIVMGGKIDRVDRKDDTVRIIDYKTGKDENRFESIPALFQRSPKRNKAAFQAMLYAWVYAQRHVRRPDEARALQPGLINRREIFKDDFEYGLFLGRQRLEDVTDLLPAFEEQLLMLLEEMFDPAVPFDQTEELKTCQYCDYKEICQR
ncbi:PD-(D/E)XK nuclease family protein [Dawidia soli]|uniref:PD-(D/E)XK nuclease family protein n=1 Tax=Dawidia soli TaxID=2782352 RepID=A0AAP2DF59_9BACT|nr:PD-(D/E)XK nuclease family protein [Dawidia soli]MBT1688242.1 PD-(D/E)XK nuclease family protein [Dawidia soli]